MNLYPLKIRSIWWARKLSSANDSDQVSVLISECSVCKENAENAHTLIHLKYALNQWVIGSLESQGHLTIEKLAKRDEMSAKKRQKEVNHIVDKWNEEKEIKELYRIWKQQLETAQNASTTGRRY